MDAAEGRPPHHGSFSGLSWASSTRNIRCSAAMPFKHNASRRHRIGKMKFKVT
jgi:hypothetical protein